MNQVHLQVALRANDYISQQVHASPMLNTKLLINKSLNSWFNDLYDISKDSVQCWTTEEECRIATIAMYYARTHNVYHTLATDAVTVKAIKGLGMFHINVLDSGFIADIKNKITHTDYIGTFNRNVHLQAIVYNVLHNGAAAHALIDHLVSCICMDTMKGLPLSVANIISGYVSGTHREIYSSERKLLNSLHSYMNQRQVHIMPY